MSGRKSLLPAYKLLSAEGLDADFTSEPITLNTINRIAINIKTTGVTDNTGSFSVEQRIYKDVNQFSDWVTLTLSTVPTLNDADDGFLLDLNLPPGQFRIKFTAAGGTPDGTCDVWVTGTQEG